MSESASPARPKVFLVAVAAILVVTAIVFGVMHFSKPSSGEEAVGGEGGTASKGATRHRGESSRDPRHDGKSDDKTEEERIAGKPAPPRETPKALVARVTMEAEAELKTIQERSGRYGPKPGREARLRILKQAQSHWKMAEDVSKNPQLRSEAFALNRKLAKWVEESGAMDQETFEAGFKELRSALGDLRKRNGSSGRSRVNKPIPTQPQG